MLLVDLASKSGAIAHETHLRFRAFVMLYDSLHSCFWPVSVIEADAILRVLPLHITVFFWGFKECRLSLHGSILGLEILQRHHRGTGEVLLFFAADFIRNLRVAR